MIASVRRFEYPELKKQLDSDDQIVVFSCNHCAKKCKGLGGRVGLQKLSEKLEADGFHIVHKELCGLACSVDLVKRRRTDEVTRPFFERADTIIPLACEDGEATVKYVFPEKKVIKLAKNLGLGWGSPKVGVRIVQPLAGVSLQIPFPEGISLDEAAERLGLYAGSF
jgi:hypothetical protein